MKRLAAVAALMLVALAISASASAAIVTYGGYSWPAGQAYSTSYSPYWWRNVFSKMATFDTTVTFIDNVSYSWHFTLRSHATFLSIHWHSSQTKKAHCRANQGSSAWAACAASS